MSFKPPLFSIGDAVENKADKEIGEVISWTYDPDNGYRYRVSSKEVDITAKEVIHGYKNVLEDEIQHPKKKAAKKSEEGNIDE